MSILDTYKQRLKESESYCTPHWERAIDNYKHYLGRLDVGGMNMTDYPFSSQMSVSLSYEVVETVLPRIIGKDPEFTTTAVEPQDVPFEQTAKMAVDLGYNNPKLELMGEPIFLKLNRFVKELLITGNAVGRPFWRRERTKQVRYLANYEKAGIKDEPDISKVYKLAGKNGKDVTFSKKLVDSPLLDDFDLRHVPFFMYYPDVPMIETGRMRYHIERDYTTFEELADEAEIFGYDKAVMDEIAQLVSENKSGFTPDVGKRFMEDYNDLFSSINPAAFKSDDKKVPLLIVDKMWTGDKVYVFVNEKYNLTGKNGMKNPYDVMKNPFIFGHDILLPHSYFSYGEIDSMKKLEDGANDMMNMRFDNLLSSMLNIWLFNPNLVAEDDEFQPIPNSLTAVQDVDKAVRVISGNNVTAGVYKEADEMYRMIQRITGTNDYVKGAEGETLAGRTYGGMRLVQEAANARFIIKARTFEKVTLKALGYFILEMSKQFINKDRVRRLFGEDAEITEYTLEAGKLKSIKGMMDMHVIPNSSMVIDQQAEAIKLNSLADRFMAAKGPFANIPNEVFDKFLLKYLPLYGVTDAVYWVREIRKSREQAELEAKKAEAMTSAPKPQTQPAPTMPSPVAPIMGGQEVIQSDQIAGGQPNPIEQILNAGGLG